VAVGTAWYVTKRRRIARGFQATRIPPDGTVAEYQLTMIERDEGVRIGGIQAFDAKDTGRDITFQSLMQRDDTVLYTYNVPQNILVFLTVPSKADLWKEPFLDRGVRKLASSTVFVCSIETAEKYMEAERASLPCPSRDTFLFVWNTGRCGSTLLARLTSAASDSVTLSEPDWCDQLKHDNDTLAADPTTQDRLVKILHVIDFQLARTLLPEPASGKRILYSLNPKGMAGFLRDPVTRVFPAAKHVFMYRDMTKVVESFGSIFGNKSKLSMVQMLTDRFIGGPGGAMPQPESRRLQEVLGGGDVRLPKRMLVKMLSTMWLDAMLHWMQFCEAQRGSMEVFTLRMEEFVTKDMAKREAIVKEVLQFAQVPHDSPGLIENAMAVFGTHSQAGTAMEKSSAKTGAKFLSEDDIAQLKDFCAQVPEIGKPDFIIPGSAGVQK